MTLLAWTALMNSTAASQEGGFTLTYEGATLFRTLDGRAALQDTTSENPAVPLYLGYPHGPKTAEFVPKGRVTAMRNVVLPGPMDGIVTASNDAFAANDSYVSPVGSVFGHPASTLDNAIYDRKHDWLISFSPDVRITLQSPGKFLVRSISPDSVEVTFRPHYYRDHLGYFLWDNPHRLWPKPIAGWCSWMAHLQDVTEKDVLDAARFFSANLRDYGYSVIQIDDGYQRVSQFPKGDEALQENFSRYWTVPNDKFPSGLKSVAKTITDLGMTPGIWIGYYLPLGLHHAEGYVTDPDGKPHQGPWVNYAMNGLDEAARDEAYIDTIRTLRADGWRYFKIDTLRHILYDSYRKVPAYWAGRKQSMEEAYRSILAATKKAAGSDSYVLACWGTLPELAGLPDGARIGEDVSPDVASMRKAARYISQFQYLNDVVWRNDPDYMCLRVPVPQAKAWATLTLLAGGHVMVSDPVSAYDADRVDILRKVGPPLVTRPSNVISRDGPPEFMSLAAEKQGESWTVIGHFRWSEAEPRREVLLQNLGLEDRRDYLAFDFWNEKFMGVVNTRMNLDSLSVGQCQAIALRPLADHPQILGTNRHLSQGAYELDDIKWNGQDLGGRFHLGVGRRWSVYLHAPSGWKYAGVDGDKIESHVDGSVVKLTFPEGAGTAQFTSHWERGF